MIWVQHPDEKWQYFGIDVESEKVIVQVEHTNIDFPEEDRFWGVWLVQPEWEDWLHIKDCNSLEEAKAAAERALADDRQELDQIGQME